MTAPQSVACGCSYPLYHVHLPKLADAGVLQFDRAAGRITRAGGAERVFEVLDAVAAQSAD